MSHGIAPGKNNGKHILLISFGERCIPTHIFVKCLGLRPMGKSQMSPEIRSARRLHRLGLQQQPQSSVPRTTARHAGQAGKSWPRCLRKTPPGKIFVLKLDAAPSCTVAHLKNVIDSFKVPGTGAYSSGRKCRGRWCINISNRTA